MAGFSNGSETKYLEDMVGKSPVANRKVGLWVGAPNDDGLGGTAATGTGYAMQQTAAADWNNASAGDPSSIDTANAVSFGPAGAGGWNGGATNFDHFAIFEDNETTFLGWGTISNPRNAAENDTLEFPAGSLSITLE